jgi:uncharacterized protein
LTETDSATTAVQAAEERSIGADPDRNRSPPRFGRADRCSTLCRVAPESIRSRHAEDDPLDIDTQETIDFLTASLPPPVERIDTHAAVVLLAGDLAYKLKRSVRFSFLDYSTLARRERALRDELRLNLRTAPEIYRRLVPVTRRPSGELALDDSGAVVEWLLEMNRFPPDATLDCVAARGDLDFGIVDQLAAVIADFHAHAEIRPTFGGDDSMRGVVDENQENLVELANERLPRTRIDTVHRLTCDALDAHRGLLDTRRAAGRVRQCHGDLHLKNIVVLDGRPVLFDCIEFNEQYACIDVLYDLAFCVMDLLDRGYPVLAHRLLQGWIELTEDDGGLALLPAFLAIRATIRAKVTALAARLRPGDPGDVDRAQQAFDYLALAERVLAPAPARVVALGGRSGTGKSAVAMALAPSLGALPGAIVLRSDVIRKAMLGRRPTDRLGDEAYTPTISASVYARVRERVSVIVGGGHSAIVDSVFGQPPDRASLASVGRERGVPFTGIWLIAPQQVLFDRVAGRFGDASDADAAIVRAQSTLADVRPEGWHVIDADRPLDAVVADVRAAIRCDG